MKVLDSTVTQLTIPTPFMVGDTHLYLIKGEVLSLVDAGVKTKEAWELINLQLRELGYFPNDIEQIILTHHHPDHTGLIDNFPRVKNIVAHKYVDSWLRKDTKFSKEYEQFFRKSFKAWGVPLSYFNQILENLRAQFAFGGEGELTSTIDEGDLLPGHSDWQVIETKGHAQSHLSFLREKDGVFIGGDHLLEHIASNPLLEAPYDDEIERAKSSVQYRANLKKCLSLDISTVLPGHGKTFSHVTELIQLRLKKQENHANKVCHLLREKAQTPFEICQQIFPRHIKKELELTMSETIGQLDFLEEQGKIEKEIDNGIIYYGKI